MEEDFRDHEGRGRGEGGGGGGGGGGGDWSCHILASLKPILILNSSKCRNDSRFVLETAQMNELLDINLQLEDKLRQNRIGRKHQPTCQLCVEGLRIENP